MEYHIGAEWLRPSGYHNPKYMSYSNTCEGRSWRCIFANLKRHCLFDTKSLLQWCEKSSMATQHHMGDMTAVLEWAMRK